MKKALLNVLSFAMADAATWFTTLWSGAIGFLALGGGFVLALVQKYLIRDLAFLPWLIVIITLDTISGYRLAKKRWRENPEKYPEPTNQLLREKLGGKAVAITIALVMLNVLTNFEVSGLPAQQSFVNIPLFGYEFDLNVFKVIYFSGAVYLIAIEAKSTIRNLSALGYNIFPKKVIDLVDKVTEGKDEGNNI